MNNSNNGDNSLFLSMILAIFSWLTPEKIDIGIKVLTALGAITAGIFAARYHYYAAKEKKERIKRLKRDRDRDEEIFS